MTAKEEFIKIYTENIKRPGSDKLLEYLKSNSSDFLLLLQAQDTMVLMRAGLLNTVLMFITVLLTILTATELKNFIRWITAMNQLQSLHFSMTSAR